MRSAVTFTVGVLVGALATFLAIAKILGDERPSTT